jgi:cell division septation protein DedD
MANFDRYEPTDQPGQAFDGGEHDDDREGSGSRLPLLLILGLLVVAAFAGVVWLAYTQGVQRGASAVQPSQSAGSTPSVAGLKIYEQRAPLDETPAAAASSPKPAPSAAEPRVLPDKASEPAKLAQASTAQSPTSRAVPTAAPSPRPQAPVAQPAVLAPSAATPVSQSDAHPTPAPSPAPVAAKSPSATLIGKFLLQIGAFKSEDDAKAAWSAFRQKHPAVADYAPDIHKVDLGAKGIWYRVRLGKFETRDAAMAFCAKLKADGGACFLAR